MSIEPGAGATQPLPAIFFAHGNPMNALADNAITRQWRAVGASIPPPRAILCISAHWYVPGLAVTINQQPPTIHDFGGFPRELFEKQYPAPGSPPLAARVQELLAPLAVAGEAAWGLDHGCWSVLCHVFPRADVPVVELSIDLRQPNEFHYEIGRLLAPLREEGVLLMGSGNVVHNLRTYRWGDEAAPPYAWAARFDGLVREATLRGDDRALIHYAALDREAALSVPTPEHYLPLLYILGARLPGDAASFPTEGIEGGSLSMLTVQLG
jgi:4,5-DOPA dioxygenase extradiol